MKMRKCEPACLPEVVRLLPFYFRGLLKTKKSEADKPEKAELPIGNQDLRVKFNEGIRSFVEVPFILVSLLTSVFSSPAQNVYYQLKSLHGIDTNTTNNTPNDTNYLEVKDPHYFKKMNANIQHQNSKIRFVFFIDDAQHLNMPDSGFYRLDIKIEWADKNADSSLYFTHLDLDFRKSGKSNNRSELQWTDAYRVKVKILRIRNRQGQVIPFTNIPKSLCAELIMESNEKILCPYISASSYNLHAAKDVNKKRINIHWNALPCADFYELEWVYADDYALQTGNPQILPAPGIYYYFPRKAMRVRVNRNFYSLPMVFGRGYVVFRVRAVSANAAYSWSLPDNYDWVNRKGIYPVSNLTGAYSDDFVYVQEGERYQKDKNWFYEFVADEEGKAHHSITYYDGLLLKKQEIDVFSTDSVSVIKEWFYDVLGRESIVTLPTAEVQNDLLGYYGNLNKNSGGTKYHYPDFMHGGNMSCINSVIPSALNANSGAGKYYSPNNNELTAWNNNSITDRSIPDAEGYPFAMKIYVNEPEGRIREAGMAGKKLQPGGGKTTKYFYGSPTQEEIDRLLGNNAGYASFYTKILSKDPEQQWSVEIKDVKGNTVIQGLDKQSDSLLTVDTNKVKITSVLLKRDTGEWVDGELTDGMKRNFDKTLVMSGGQVQFSYNISVPSYNPVCKTNECYDCAYNFDLEIKDDCGNNYLSPSPVLWKSGLNADTLNTACDSTLRKFSLDTTNLWKASEAHISRHLELDSAAMENYFQLWLKNNLCIRTFQDFLDVELGKTDSSLCDLGCETVNDSIVSAHGVPSDSLALLACNNSMAHQDLCSSIRMLMEGDVSPGGQYGLYNRDENTGNITSAAPDNYSVFYGYGAGENYLPKIKMWKKNYIPNKPSDVNDYAYWYPNLFSNGTWKGYYADANGNKDTVWLDASNTISNTYLRDTTKKFPGANNIFYTFPQYLSKEKFVDMFKPSWALSLLLYHPEFFYWYRCVTEISSANSTIQQFNNSTIPIYTFAFDDSLEVHPEWLLDSNFSCNITNIDPFFTSQKGTMPLGRKWFRPYDWDWNPNWLYNQNDTNFYCPFGKSAVQRMNERMLNYAGGLSIFQIAKIKCGLPYDNALCKLQNDTDAAVMAVTFYKNLKREVLMEYLHQRAMLNNAYNGAIGTTAINNSNLLIALDSTQINSQLQQLQAAWQQPSPVQWTDLWQISACSYHPSAFSHHPFFDLQHLQQISNFISVSVLSQKQKRWGRMDELLGLDSSLYLGLTVPNTDGLEQCRCKNAQALNTLLGDLFEGAHLPGTIGIDTCSMSFTPALSQILGGNFTVNSFLSNNYRFLNVNFLPMPAAPCSLPSAIILEIDTPAWLNWNYPELLALQNLQYVNITNGVRNFTMSLWYKDSAGFFQKAIIKGKTCLPIDSCGTTPSTPSSASCFQTLAGTNLNNIITYLGAQGKLTVNDTVPRYLVNNSLWNNIYFGNPPFHWQYGPNNSTAYFSGTNGGITMHFNKNLSSLPDTLLFVSTKCINSSPCSNKERFYYYWFANNSLHYDSMEVTSAKLLLCCCGQPGTGGQIGEPPPPLCMDFPPVDELPTDTMPDPCIEAQLANAAFNAQNYYGMYIDSLRNDFYAKYKKSCWKVKERMALRVKLPGNYWTVYEYDDAKNLLRTIPPEGVKPLDSLEIVQVQNYRNGITAVPKYPAHTLTSQYRYNSQNQELERHTPDGGLVKTFYDKALRVAAVQNDEEKKDTLWSYLKYDYKGRTAESGVGHSTNYQFVPTESDLSNTNHPGNWLAQKKEVVKSLYDVPYTPIPYTPTPYTQTNLRNRISAVWRDEDGDGKSEHTYIYSYDISGNVWDLWQYIAELKPYNNEWKHFHYEFDLVSGKVKELTYQKNKPDQWLHKYFYDADNRIKKVYTSRDGWYWERDAQYEYYLHGPLKRVEIGERQVQGLDFVYTINGWLKSLNHSSPDSSRDAGSDGLLNHWHQFVAKDILNYELKYFSGDYKAIGNYGTNNFSNFVSLYNGNIAATIISQDTMQVLARTYRYDALNRLRTQNVFSQSGNNFLPINSWAANYAYDKMGNILKLNRWAQNGIMDSLNYNYYAGKNQLNYITDAVANAAFTNDIDNQNKNNYVYDAVGNLTKDASENLKIHWTNYGKVKQIDSLNTPKLNFTYDALGNRITKENILKNEKEIYVRDAQGNILALYEIKNDSLFAKEFYMYGSQRLGYTDENIFLAKKNSIFPTGNFSTLKKVSSPKNVNYTFGNKRYEINDWLGNVRAVVTDKKIPDSYSGNLVTSYKPEVVSSTDYFPFGMEMPERNFNRENYRFGFSGHEMLNEISGSGNQIDLGARYLDTRLGRIPSPDPLMKNYPYLSPYVYALNTPLQAIDPDGKLVIFVNGFVKNQWIAHQYFSYNNIKIPYRTNEISTNGSPQYLGKNFSYWEGTDKLFKERFEDYNSVYINASDWATSQASERYVSGMESGTNLIQKIQSGEITLAKDETIKLVGHSQGGAHAAGMAYILNYAYQKGIIKNPVEQIYYLAPHQPTDFKTPEGIFSVQYSRLSDMVSSQGDLSFMLGSIYGKIRNIGEMPPMRNVNNPLELGGHFVGTFKKEIFGIPKGEPGYVRKSISEQKEPAQSNK